MSVLRIKVLVEDTAFGRGLLGEHGLAIWIELGSRRILFDTGQGAVLSPNARKLDVRLEQADALIVSHGHYDHIGGLGDVARRIPRARAYAHPDAFGPKFARTPNGRARHIGMPASIRQEVRESAELVWTTEPTEVVEGLFVTGPIPRVVDFEDTGGPFYTDVSCTQADSLLDDQAVFVDRPDGIMVILGCAHAGVINTLLYVRQLTGNRPIHTVVGGMHLRSADATRIGATVAEIRRLGVKRLAVGHCTGAAASAQLLNEFPERCIPCHAGTVLE